MIEEPRRLTLARIGLVYERTMKYNDNPVCTGTVQPFHELMPIPQQEIDVNQGAELTQNPGY